MKPAIPSKFKKTTLKGELRWAKLTEQPKGLCYKSKDKYQWEVNLIVPKSTAEKFASRSQSGKTHQDKEGNYYLPLKRKELGVKEDGDTYELGYPLVYMKDDTTTEVDRASIGNGTTASVVVEMVPYGNNLISPRLYKVYIEDLVEYKSEDEDDDDDGFEWD